MNILAEIMLFKSAVNSNIKYQLCDEGVFIQFFILAYYFLLLIVAISNIDYTGWC